MATRRLSKSKTAPEPVAAPTPPPKPARSAMQRIRDILASATDPSNKLDRIASIAREG